MEDNCCNCGYAFESFYKDDDGRFKLHDDFWCAKKSKFVECGDKCSEYF